MCSSRAGKAQSMQYGFQELFQLVCLFPCVSCTGPVYKLFGLFYAVTVLESAGNHCIFLNSKENN